MDKPFGHKFCERKLELMLESIKDEMKAPKERTARSYGPYTDVQSCKQ